MGPTFNLTLWDTHRTDQRGASILRYRLTMVRPGRLWCVLFDGEDFVPSPLYAIDSDDTVEAIMGFLTLRPGDTDADYFEPYTPAQLNYCDQHAEALGIEVMRRFGKEE
jgi:hypothetical protein